MEITMSFNINTPMISLIYIYIYVYIIYYFGFAMAAYEMLKAMCIIYYPHHINNVLDQQPLYKFVQLERGMLMGTTEWLQSVHCSRRTIQFLIHISIWLLL